MKAEEFAKSKATFFLDVWKVDIFHRDTIEKQWQHRRRLMTKNPTLTKKIRKGLADSFFQSYIPSDILTELAQSAKKLEDVVKK